MCKFFVNIKDSSWVYGIARVCVRVFMCECVYVCEALSLISRKSQINNTDLK